MLKKIGVVTFDSLEGSEKGGYCWGEGGQLLSRLYVISLNLVPSLHLQKESS